MPSITPVTLAAVPDSTGTSKTFTMTPVAPQNGDSAAQWRDLTQSVYSNQIALTSAVLVNKGPTQARRVKATLTVPLTRDVAGVPTSIGLNRVDVEFRLLDAGTKLERSMLRNLVAKVLASPQFTSQIEDLLAEF